MDEKRETAGKLLVAWARGLEEHGLSFAEWYEKYGVDPEFALQLHVDVGLRVAA